MKRSLAILTAPALLSGCSGEQPIAPPDGEKKIDPSVLMPLTVGNSWTCRRTFYEGPTPFVSMDTLRIVGDTLYNGARWYLTNNGTYYSLQGKSLFATSSLDGEDIDRIATMATAVGDTFGDYGIIRDSLFGPTRVLSFHRFSLVTALDAPVTVPAGSFRGIRSKPEAVTIDSTVGTVEVSDESYAIFVPGIGEVFSVQYNPTPGADELLEIYHLVGYDFK